MPATQHACTLPSAFEHTSPKHRARSKAHGTLRNGERTARRARVPSSLSVSAGLSTSLALGPKTEAALYCPHVCSV